MQTFLTALADNAPNVSIACTAADISRKNAYKWRDKTPDFKEAWDNITEVCVDETERFLTLVSQGKEDAKPCQVTAAIFMLKCRRRKVYGERFVIDEDTPPDARYL